MNNFSPSDTWFEIAGDAITAAKQGMSLAQYDYSSKIAAVGVGKSYSDRLNVLDNLVADRLILIRDKHLKLGEVAGIGWLDDLLDIGSKKSWELVDSIDPAYREKKFDSMRLQQIGLTGEEFIIRYLKSRLPESVHERIEHISLHDDSAGFDIVTPSLRDHEKRVALEVKTTVAPSVKFRCFVSENEFNVGVRTAQWHMVAVKIEEGVCRLVGHTKAFRLESMMPKNRSKDATWSSVKLSMPEDFFEPDLP